tara:strand:- start:5910 stop:6020 length:111 start_codon:yes stop_codon:yes gene_type:complete
MYNTLKLIVFVWIVMTILLIREGYLFIKEEKKKNGK